MSVINQMLRELDARVAPTLAPDAHVPADTQPPRKRLGLWLSLGLSLFVAVSGLYWALSQTQSPVVVSSQQAEKRALPRLDVHPAPSVSPMHLPRVIAPVDRPHTETVTTPRHVQVQAGKTQLPVTERQVGRLAVELAPPATLPTNTGVSKILVDTPEIDASQMFDAAENARRAGNYATALVLYRQALARSPMQAQTRLRLASLLRELGQPSEALLVLEDGHALRAQPVLAIAAGRLLVDLGRREDALDWLKRGRESAQPADFALMGALYAQSQRHEEAVMAYQRALAVDASQGGWFLGLGVSLEASGHRDEARIAYRRALERGTFKPDVEKFLRDKLDASG